MRKYQICTVSLAPLSSGAIAGWQTGRVRRSQPDFRDFRDSKDGKLELYFRAPLKIPHHRKMLRQAAEKGKSGLAAHGPPHFSHAAPARIGASSGMESRFLEVPKREKAMPKISDAQPVPDNEQNSCQDRNAELFNQACRYFPGGVNSPVRSFQHVQPRANDQREEQRLSPLFAVSGSGPLLRDAEGRDYIDLCCSWGALPLGHADRRVQVALARQLQLGFSYGMPTETENLLAQALQRLLPQLEQLRFVSSGTEACMSALRLARACTGRDKILKFGGCYHGHTDYLLVEAGSGAAGLAGPPGQGVSGRSRPSSSGVPQALAELCLTLPYNDLAASEQLLAQRGAEIAAVIVEPVAANMGLVLPEEGFLPGLRRACDRSGSLLIFDEVISGLRLHNREHPSLPGSAATHFGVQADLSCFGKAIGGGLPLAAYGGRRELMARLMPGAPAADCYQAGTLSGNPLATAAGLATIKALEEDWPAANAQWRDFIAELEPLLRKGGAALAHCGSLLCIYPDTGGGRVPRNFAEAQVLARSCASRQGSSYADFFWRMLQHDIYLSPSPYESLFLSTAHDVATLDFLLRQFGDYFHKKGSGRF